MTGASHSYLQLAVAALQANPMVLFTETQIAGLEDPSFDISFSELEMDSLARMELSIWLEVEHGLEVTEGELEDVRSLQGLSRLLQSRLA